MLAGITLAMTSAALYGLGGVAISRAPRGGDGGVLLAALVTSGLSLALWSVAGRVPLADVRLEGAMWFAVAGILATAFGRQAMYAATALIGAVRSGIFRHLIPVFALPAALLLLDEWPGGMTLLGGALILGGVLLYTRLPTGAPSPRGMFLGIASAAAYGSAYAVRGLGLHSVPDPALGAFIGAITAVIWLILTSGASLRQTTGRWHWVAAAALSAGQTVQFFALLAAPVAIVAVIVTLEVLFAALLIRFVFRSETVHVPRLMLCALLASIGTGLMLL